VGALVYSLDGPIDGETVAICFYERAPVVWMVDELPNEVPFPRARADESAVVAPRRCRKMVRAFLDHTGDARSFVQSAECSK